MFCEFWHITLFVYTLHTVYMSENKRYIQFKIHVNLQSANSCKLNKLKTQDCMHAAVYLYIIYLCIFTLHQIKVAKKQNAKL